jgi:hypothetical protein
MGPVNFKGSGVPAAGTSRSEREKSGEQSSSRRAQPQPYAHRRRSRNSRVKLQRQSRISPAWAHLTFPDVESPLSGPWLVRNLSRATIEVARTLAPYNGAATASSRPWTICLPTPSLCPQLKGRFSPNRWSIYQIFLAIGRQSPVVSASLSAACILERRAWAVQTINPSYRNVGRSVRSRAAGRIDPIGGLAGVSATCLIRRDLPNPDNLAHCQRIYA